MAGEPGGDASRQLGWAKATLEAAGFEAPTETIAGDPEQVIAQAILEREIDMLIMGAYTHSPLRSLFFGSRTSDLLRAATIPTLLLR
jgi:nucleotide-binding universal stress UspA family protein